ncbi:MAG: hypothetical protein ACRDGT_12530, partial [Candidatus Limnocylindria bacterium]
MSCGAIAEPGLHPLIAFTCYGAALALVTVVALARASPVTERLATVAAAAALTAALGMLLAGRTEVAPLALAALIPLGTVGLILARGTALERAGIPLLALALIVAVADRQIFLPGPVGPDVLLAAAVAAVAAPLAFGAGRWRPALYGVVLAAYALTAWIVLGAQPYRTDTIAATHGAAELLLAGRHPYAEFDMFERLERFDIPAAFATDLEDGSELRSLNYPALAFLVPAPLVAAGLADVRLLYLGEVILLLALVTLSAREPWRPYVLAAGIGGIALMRQFVTAGVDPAWALFLV